jgi:hypothetical protein
MALTRVAQARQVSNPTLSDYLDQLDSIVLEARELTNGLTPQQFTWRPSERGWSIGQCLEHLTRTVKLYVPRIEVVIEESRQRKGRGEKGYRDGLLAAWLIRTMEPPPGLRIRTFRAIEPAGSADPVTVLAEFEASHARLADLMVAADGVSLSHGRMSSPFAAPIRFTLRQAFAVNLAHGRRHLWQARQVRSHGAFPAAAAGPGGVDARSRLNDDGRGSALR